MRFKRLLKLIAPPILFPVWHRFTPRPEWRFVASNWPHDDRRASGWENPSIVRAQRGRWPQFVRAVVGSGPLGISHELPAIASDTLWAHNAVMSYGYVLARAAIGKDRLVVLDWGGGLGHYFVLGKALLPEMKIEYTIVDLPALCQAGRELLPEVCFAADAGRWRVRRYNVVFASGSLQFAADWRHLVGDLASVCEDWMYLTRVPVVRDAPSFVVSQRPHAVGYHTEYIGWVLNREELLAYAASIGLHFEREFLISAHSYVVGAPEQPAYSGFLFRAAAKTRRPPIVMASFPAVGRTN